jgi:hypothetical protein
MFRNLVGVIAAIANTAHLIRSRHRNPARFSTLPATTVAAHFPVRVRCTLGSAAGSMNLLKRYAMEETPRTFKVAVPKPNGRPRRSDEEAPVSTFPQPLPGLLFCTLSAPY